MRRFGVPATARASFYVYNSNDEVDASSRLSARPRACSPEGESVALDDIYKEVILDHYKNPRNKREMPDAELSCSKNNPLCGDEITVFVHEDDGKVLDVVRRAGVLDQPELGLDDDRNGRRQGRDEVEERIGAFRGMMAGEVEADEDAFGELVALKGGRSTRCA